MSEDVIKGDKILEDMAATYRERNATYGNNCTKVGQILAILYPDGMQLKTADDFTRWHLVDWMVGKLTRFACGNHLDSIHDLAVYAAMVEGWLKHEEDKRNSKETTHPFPGITITRTKTALPV
jgi:hypothetical protein